jgi:hypothetical protein
MLLEIQNFGHHTFIELKNNFIAYTWDQTVFRAKTKSKN